MSDVRRVPGGVTILSVCLVAVLIAACIPQPTVEPTPTTSPTRADVAEEPAPTASPTVPPTDIPTPAPLTTSTGTQPPATQAEPTQAQPPPPEEKGPAIHSFLIQPAEGVSPGDTVTASWSATGSRARLCQSTYGYYGGECSQVPLSGSQPFTIDRSEGVILFALLVYGATDGDEVQATVEIDLGCTYEWAFDAGRATKWCPDGPALSGQMAAQRFERGWMLWIRDRGYIVLQDAHATSVPGSMLYSEVFDPLTIVEDTSDTVSPPQGYYAPTSGFGLVWRGDVLESPGYRDIIGWAMLPEFGYQASFQCRSLRGYVSSVLGSLGTCYVDHPAGGIAALVRGEIECHWYMVR